MLAMFNNAPGTNGSMFFITLAPAPQFNGLYTIFGQVISGIEILSALEVRDPQPGIPLVAGEKIISISVQEK
jgi:cyclophilin family peptidyl-prolyl cis-trans isomerase